MKLTIQSLKGTEFEGEALAFNVKTLTGEITVLDNHRPIITALGSCNAKITKKNGDTEYKKIKTGFLEMDRNNNLSVLIG